MSTRILSCLTWIVVSGLSAASVVSGSSGLRAVVISGLLLGFSLGLICSAIGDSNVEKVSNLDSVRF